jgi:hypothetical protein
MRSYTRAGDNSAVRKALELVISPSSLLYLFKGNEFDKIPFFYGKLLGLTKLIGRILNLSTAFCY